MAPQVCQPKIACPELGFHANQDSLCSRRWVSNKGVQSQNKELSVHFNACTFIGNPSIHSSCLPGWSVRNCRKPLTISAKVKGSVPKVGIGRCRFWRSCKETTSGSKANGFRFSARRSRKLPRSGFVHAKGDDSTPSEMSFENALKLLGVEEKASFDEILKAKRALVESSAGDEKRISEVEAAYDALLMERLMKRRAGEVADSSVLYADVKARKPSFGNAGSKGVKWLRSAINSVPLSVELPSLTVLGTQTAVYSVLIALDYTNGLAASTGSSFQDTRADAPGLILAIGFGASLLFLQKQRLTLGKAAAITTASLVAGAVVGGMVEAWLHVDIVPIFGVSSPAVLVSEFGLISMWLASLYLR